MKELNLIRILRNVPIGTKFYSTNFGECTFNGIKKDCADPIIIEVTDIYGIKRLRRLTEIGSTDIHFNGECILFPSYDNRDWSTYKYEPIPIGTPVMCKRDNAYGFTLRYYAGDGKVFIYGDTRSCGVETFSCIIPGSKFDFENPDSEENLKKSIV